MKDNHLVLSFTTVLLVPSSHMDSIIFEMRRITQANIHNLSKQYLPKVAKLDDEMLMVKKLAEKLKTNPDKGIHEDESSILERKTVFGSNTYPRRKGNNFWSLSHLGRFREEFLSTSKSAHLHVGDPCVTCALHDIFKALNTTSTDSKSQAVAPTALRIALGNLYPHSSFFQEAQMNDASEVLGVIFDCLHREGCDPQDGGCGKLNYIHHILSTPPHIFTTILGWQNTCEIVEDINVTLAALSTEIDLSVLYRGLDPNNRRTLVSVVCYYGQHYHCFAYSHARQRWVMYDDKTVKVIGRWEDVVSMCEKGHLQPQVMLMEERNMKPLDTNLAALSARCSKDLELNLAKSFLSEMGQYTTTYPYN
ncbi:unnamed protein product [Lactuca saligna]|uniref:Peptidase C19 ubiquitin carboxyl-terminal hydrolase domain-containing protein n=1 Tax=Lactuca saligna TaxID=75948 RepID=A0AA35Z2M1_LACSI|nr:unnamed protein product [Lactuca saligna]